MCAVHHWVTLPRILRCYRYSGYVRCTPLGDPRVCHVAIGTLGEGYARCTPLGDPRVCHVYTTML